MSLITIQCSLIAKESTRQTLWELMAGLNTPFVNELLQKVAQYPEFESWQRKGTPKVSIIKELGNELKKDPRYIGQPARFYTSGINLVEYIFKSWLKLQQCLQQKLDRQIRWLSILKSDAELVEESQASLDTIRTEATAILKSYESRDRLFTKLFDAYNNERDNLKRTTLRYLLKNHCRVPKKAEDPDKFAKKRQKTEIRIQRLQKQIDSRLPKGRDLTNEKWLETLAIASITDPKDDREAKTWQNILLTKSKTISFPIGFETNEDLSWSHNEKGRLCVRFNGLSKLTFEIYCDRRQLRWFQRFYEDAQIKKADQDRYSSALFTLRSGRILWIKGKKCVGDLLYGLYLAAIAKLLNDQYFRLLDFYFHTLIQQRRKEKGKPWNMHRLTLQCTIDTRLWTQEGTEQVKHYKADEIAKDLTKMNKKGDLTKNQQASVKRKRSTLNKLENPFPRPSQPLYRGQPNILVGVSMGLKQPATVAVVDGSTGKVLTYQSLKQLLGKNYPLINRQRQQKQRQSHQRSVAQRKEAFNQFGDSELGQYIDRLLAKEIITVAQKYRAGSIVVPKLDDLREIVESEIQARAEQKIPNCIEAQAKYAKSYRIKIHQWSYARLIENIQAQASKSGIFVEEDEQAFQGSPQQKAKGLAIAAYRSRYLS